MDSFKNSVAFWATILGTVVACVGAFQSLAWVFVAGAIVAIMSIGALTYAHQQRARLKAASIKIAERSIDSLNAASLRRRLNRSLVIEKLTVTPLRSLPTLTGTVRCPRLTSLRNLRAFT